jgi:hypothetical protein
MTRGELHRLMHKVDREKARHHEALVRRMETHLGALLSEAPPYVWLRSYWHGPSAVEWFPYGHDLLHGKRPETPARAVTPHKQARFCSTTSLSNAGDRTHHLQDRGRVPRGPTTPMTSRLQVVRRGITTAAPIRGWVQTQPSFLDWRATHGLRFFALLWMKFVTGRFALNALLGR